MPRFLLSFLLFFLFAGALQAQTPTEVESTDPLQITARVEPYSLSPGQGGEFIFEFELPKNFHAYADQFKFVILEPMGFQHQDFKLDPVIEFYDKFSKKNRQGIKEKAQMRVVFESPPELLEALKQFKVEITYQACSETYCLFPKKKEVDVPFQWLGPIRLASTPSTKAEPTDPFWSQTSVTQVLTENLPLAFLFIFFAGILTSFTPCIFPMIPITLAILGHDAEKRSRKQNFFLSIFYVHGIATTYSLLGLIAASSGQLFGSSLGNPIVLGILCAIFFAMALSMYGVFEIQVPIFLRDSLSRHKTGANYLGAYLSGIVAGVVASPCVGPVLVTLLTFVASTQDHLLGFFLLFTYAMGLGMIFLILGAFTELVRKLPRSGAWMEATKFLLGSLMLGAFFYYLSFLIPPRWHDGVLGIALIVLASFFGAFLNVKGSGRLRLIQKGIMQGLLVVGIGYTLLAALDLRPTLLNKFTGPYDIAKPELPGWENYSEEKLAEALAAQKPVVIDFYADWCLACHELERHTFSNTEVQQALKDYVLLRFDATQESSARSALQEKYKIRGLPTVVFIDAKGQWIEKETLTEFERPSIFLKRLERLKSL